VSDVTDGDRAQAERAERVWGQIESLAEDLAEARAIAGWLRGQLNVNEAFVRSLESRIQGLHIKRNAIFHEEDSVSCDRRIVNGPHMHRRAAEEQQ
jgi:hypothetical protein